MKQAISIALVIIGALVGAGFASGQEIFSFFYTYGVKGIIGIILMCILMGFLINKTLKIICNNDIDNYNEFLNQFIKSKKIKQIINIIINTLLLISFFIMIAGFGAYFEQEIGISKYIGSIILALLCALIFFTNVKGVMKVSDFIVPVLILFIVIIGTKNIITINNINFEQIKNNWILSSILYTSYNLILLIPVLISLRKQITEQKNIKLISILSCIILIILSLMIFMVLQRGGIEELKVQEMPVAYVISKYYSKYKSLYAFIILASIFTTAISVGIGFLQNVSKNRKSYQHIVIIMCITSLIISNFGFSKLVNFAYPTFGYFGIIQILAIMLK